MKSKQIYQRIVIILSALLLLFSVFIGGRVKLPAFAAETQYSGVLHDLQKDSEFNADEFPEDSGNYSIEVITIAEGTRGELFVYTYQPCQVTQKLVAAKVNMSRAETVEGTMLYDLILLSESSVFCKYRVKDFSVNDEAVRYYNITSINRAWDEAIDRETGTNNTKDFVAFPVGKLFMATTAENGNISYYVQQVKVIQILNPYTGFISLNNGYFFDVYYQNNTDLFFVAFSTDLAIDRLKEATLSYTKYECEYTHSWIDNGTTTKKPTDIVDTIKATEKTSNQGHGIKGKYYEFPKIMSTEAFIESNDLTESATAGLKNTDWVVFFLEGERIERSNTAQLFRIWTEVEQVTVLSLEFVIAGETYKMGAVSDTVTGDKLPDNNNTHEFAGLQEWLDRITGIPTWARILIYLAVALVVVVILSLIFKPVATVVLYILKGAYLIISLPVRGIIALVRAIKAKREERKGK